MSPCKGELTAESLQYALASTGYIGVPLTGGSKSMQAREHLAATALGVLRRGRADPDVILLAQAIYWELRRNGVRAFPSAPEPRAALCEGVLAMAAALRLDSDGSMARDLARTPISTLR